LQFRPSAAQRRRTALLVLTSTVCVTGLLALVSPSAAAWTLNLLADAALVGFLGLWAWVRSLQAEQSVKVRELPARHQPEFALRRVA
jgi:ABC-type nickel/cobalt efflux system permease component RcnA